MQTITVLPIVRGALKETLTYFAKEPAPAGAIIMVPIRNRDVPALVVESKEVADSKATLKLSDFAIRKISRMRPRQLWVTPFLRAAEKTARYFAQGLGETLLSLTPKTILDAELDGTLKSTGIFTNECTTRERIKISAIQEHAKFRTESYQRLIRESFVRNESIFICLPSSEDVANLTKSLERGIEQYVFAIHNDLTKKNIIERWKSILQENHAVVVIGTPQYLTIPRYFKTIIIDEEHARTWRTITRPHIDLRTFIEYYAHEAGSNVTFGAPILRPETHKRLKNGEIDEWNRVALHARLPIQTESLLKTEIIDPRIEERAFRERTGKRNFQIIGEYIQESIAQALETNESIVLLTARKGLAPVTVCGDCGTTFRCPECETPLVIHKREGDKRIFTCHGCGFMRAPEEGEHETCKGCGGWRLEGLGIGTERVEEELKKLYPNIIPLIFDGDHIKTPAQARKLIGQFEKRKQEQKDAVLVATPMALPYLNEVEHTIVVSIDSLFAIPDFRMHERVFALILTLREKTKKTLLIQTRSDDTTLFAQATEGDLQDFTDNELMLRKTFSYPPYGTIIKITMRGKKEVLVQEMENLKTFLSEYSPLAPNTMAREPRNIFRMHLILKLAENAYPNEALINKLRTLPPQFTIEVNPDHLL